MSISAISSNATTDFQTWQATSRQRRQDFQNLATALQSGDLSGAQQAYSDLTTLMPSTSTSASSQPASTGVNAIQKDISALGQALASGNLTEAQKDFSQMKTDMQSAGIRGGHHHHHHPEAAAASSPQDGTSTSTSTSITSAASSLVSAFASATPASLVANALSIFG